MARITLDQLRHSYLAHPQADEDWALKRLDVEWEDGGAYALLGPSGCGKTTLLNIISGLLRPSEGRVLFDGEDVTPLPPERRHIAQVFQFPVIYDTMSVYDNLAFPLRTRRVAEPEVDERVRQVAEMLELGETLQRRAAGLTVDVKQKISLGRGLVRPDVNVIMFDEPLTVIDPHLKWVLRSKMKELHREISRTMIYVTHDQTEALTIADKVMVMDEGEVVQTGTPVELFERPRHTFVGHFIGSPGMNLLPARLENGAVMLGDRRIETSARDPAAAGAGRLEIGIRPEFVSFAETGVPVQVVKVSDAGRFRIVDTRHDGQIVRLLADEGVEIPADGATVRFAPQMTHLYSDGRIVE